MTVLPETDRSNFAPVFAFLGNSLLKPMNQTLDVSLDDDFWDRFPTFDSPDVRKAVQHCRAYASSILRATGIRENAIHCISAEYARLFIGPPQPAAAPWETFYSSQTEEAVGFGCVLRAFRSTVPRVTGPA